MFAVSLALLLAPAATATAAAPVCSDAAGCSWNGVCSGGRCICSPQFRGVQCDVFNFAKLDPAKGVGLQTISGGERVSSWGGSVLEVRAARMIHSLVSCR